MTIPDMANLQSASPEALAAASAIGMMAAASAHLVPDRKDSLPTLSGTPSACAGPSAEARNPAPKETGKPHAETLLARRQKSSRDTLIHGKSEETTAPVQSTDGNQRRALESAPVSSPVLYEKTFRGVSIVPSETVSPPATAKTMSISPLSSVLDPALSPELDALRRQVGEMSHEINEMRYALRDIKSGEASGQQSTCIINVGKGGSVVVRTGKVRSVMEYDTALPTIFGNGNSDMKPAEVEPKPPNTDCIYDSEKGSRPSAEAEDRAIVVHRTECEETQAHNGETLFDGNARARYGSGPRMDRKHGKHDPSTKSHVPSETARESEEHRKLRVFESAGRVSLAKSKGVTGMHHQSDNSNKVNTFENQCTTASYYTRPGPISPKPAGSQQNCSGLRPFLAREGNIVLSNEEKKSHGPDHAHQFNVSYESHLCSSSGVDTTSNSSLTDSEKVENKRRANFEQGYGNILNDSGPKKKRIRDNWTIEEDKLFFQIVSDHRGQPDTTILRVLAEQLGPRRSYQQVKGHLKNMRAAAKV